MAAAARPRFGARVRVGEIPGRQEHCGRLGTVAGDDGPCVHVHLDDVPGMQGNTILAVQPQYLEILEAPPALSVLACGLRPGEQVRVRSSLPHHAGRVAQVEREEPNGDVALRFDQYACAHVHVGHLETLEGRPLGHLPQHQLQQQLQGHVQQGFGMVPQFLQNFGGAPQQAVLPSHLQPGATVQVQGLAARPDLQGRLATVENVGADGNVRVQLHQASAGLHRQSMELGARYLVPT